MGEQLRTNPWADQDVPVVHVGSPHTARPGTVVVESLAAAVDEVAGQRDGVLFVASALTRRHRDVLDALMRPPDTRWTVVVGGEVQHARWRSTIPQDGLLDTEFLDAAVAAR